MRDNSKKLIATFLIALIIAPQLFFIGVPRAHAVGGCIASAAGAVAGLAGLSAISSAVGGFGLFQEVPVSDVVVRSTQLTLTSKECIEDTLMWVLLNIVIQFMVSDIVRWINTGFQGSPAFVESPSSFFAEVADQATGIFIETLGVAELCNLRWAPWFRISLTIPDPYLIRSRCTLSGIVANTELAFKDFKNLGWEGLVDISVNRQSSPYGAYLSALDERNKRQSTALTSEAAKLQWSNGFFSTADKLICTSFTAGQCTAYRGNITLPGATIEEQLNQALDLPKGRLAIADEVNEIIGALLTQLVIGIFQGGLRAFGG
ncbi:MAG: hypothetical protein COW88_02195 [Candidatus Lloydbacteria bacterium CG22_combo_CG10-13_8_21_14_all_47_15]|uniref:Uncharacterized protein n=1 Tax=Candidatus Lloydbacteria bacterium CG22_combo_CG10-13_8_21_14_all_47_15 TaxID=1974635 RepID=A0A2H0CU66_9BACT|nr:MAG: hypothetical protein COW88_02195 [Candidatus Lloydbacteria bacterium CG22_combo_CG10-13_8_21_14_all_47_15]